MTPARFDRIEAALALHGSRLAAMQAAECTYAEMLSVIHGRWSRSLQPHGTHAAYVRHRSHGEEPCDECKAGESDYQRARHIKRKEQRARKAARQAA